MRHFFFRAQSAFHAADAQRNAVWLFLFVLLLLLALMLPSGILDDNEEHYFALAAKFLHPDRIAGGSIIGDANSTFAYSFIVGWLIELFGYGGAQIASRVLLALLYAAVLTRLFRLFSLGLLDVALIFAGFSLLNQHILGGEFLFFGVEPKTLAYPFVVLALRDAFDAKFVRCAILLAIATTLHFLVGGFWFGFIFWFLLLENRAVSRILPAVLTYGFLCLPILIVILMGHHDQFAASPAGEGPSASWIFSVFRSGHHVAPFASLSQFALWAPRIGLLMAITLTCAALAVFESGIQSRLARLNLIALLFVVLAVLASAVDREGRLGPFVLFRPSSLALFLWLIQVACYLRFRFEKNTSLVLRAGALTLLASWLIPAESLRVTESVREAARVGESRNELYTFVKRNTGQGAIFVIDPAIERELLGFERNAGRPSLVMFKFVPTRRNDMLEWYRRLEFRSHLLTDGCDANVAYDVQYLIIPLAESVQLLPAFEACAHVALESARYVVLRLD